MRDFGKRVSHISGTKNDLRSISSSSPFSSPLPDSESSSPPPPMPTSNHPSHTLSPAAPYTHSLHPSSTAYPGDTPPRPADSDHAPTASVDPPTTCRRYPSSSVSFPTVPASPLVSARQGRRWTKRGPTASTASTRSGAVVRLIRETVSSG